jgi:DNA repair protein RecN (Recombination protein N)
MGNALLTSLTVNNFTLVERLEVDFRAGMTAITGETGAGKSLVVDALGMALGDRGDTDRIRQGADKAEVAAVFELAGNSPAHQWLRDNDVEGDSEATCLLRRVLTREGRSRGYINGRPATMQQLQQLGELMIDIHSQHEHQSLLRRDTHRRLLDAFAGCEDLAARVRDLHRDWRDSQHRLQALEEDAGESQARRELLEFQVGELDDLSPAEDELSELERDQQLLANAEQILRDSNAVLALCREGDEQGDALGFVGRSLSLLENMPERSDALNEAQGMLDNARIQIEEAAREIQGYIDGFDMDPARLQSIEERLSAIYQMARKHRVLPAELPDLHHRLREELDSLGGGEGDLDTLRARVEEKRKALAGGADKLSTVRRKAAGKFADTVNAQLASLAMTGAELGVDLSENPAPTAQGNETVELLVSTNPGQPKKPLARVASGGELSRISLAIQVVAARHTDIPTLVFDEVDVGVGGAVAEVVGRLLRELGNRGQVICVTHLPQVASCAHQHLSVSKTSGAHSAESALLTLDPAQRVEEIARMLGGARITAQTKAHAEEMLSLSAQ